MPVNFKDRVNIVPAASVCSKHRSALEPPDLTISYHTTRRGTGKVSPYDERWFGRQLRQHSPPSRLRGFLIEVSCCTPVGARHLTWVMDEVTRYERLLPLRGDADTDVPGGMAWCWLEPHFIAQLVLGFDKIH